MKPKPASAHPAELALPAELAFPAERRQGPELKVWHSVSEAGTRAPKPGEGRRFIRQLQGSGGCCAEPVFMEEVRTGRFYCGTCRRWWSASHTPGVMSAASCPLPVGIDVQVRARRPAAMRWLARTARLDAEPCMAHWVLAEAYWKASGNARRRPVKGELHLPGSVQSGWGRHAFDGKRQLAYYLQETDSVALGVVLGLPGDACCVVPGK